MRRPRDARLRGVARPTLPNWRGRVRSRSGPRLGSEVESPCVSANHKQSVRCGYEGALVRGCHGESEEVGDDPHRVGDGGLRGRREPSVRHGDMGR